MIVTRSRNAPDPQLVDTDLLVINRTGMVHAVRIGGTCTGAEHASKGLVIGPLQALVFRLNRCTLCWPTVAEYDRFIGRAS